MKIVPHPFGMVMPNRSYAAGAYRFGFNGKENDNEVKGTANQQDYGMRIYDARLGKFLSVDPLTQNYPWYTPYQFSGNNPIVFIDLDGEEEVKPDKTNNNNQPKPKALSATEIQAIREWVALMTIKPTNPIITPVTEKNKSNISDVSYGETGGIYPTKNNLYKPEKWNNEKLEQLQKARAGIIEVSKRNSDVKSTTPNIEKPLVKMLAAYHLIDNLPEADKEIKNDNDVKFFYLGKESDTKTPSISNKYYDQKIVKSYGPFYSSGGGDAGTGDIYIIFYKAVKKDNEKDKKNEKTSSTTK